jgi:hypothetical protein
MNEPDADSDATLLTRATELLTGVVAVTTTDGQRDVDTSVGLHAMAAVAHICLGARHHVDLAASVDVEPTTASVESALRDALHQLVHLTPMMFDSDPVLDAVAEIQAALAATG